MNVPFLCSSSDLCEEPQAPPVPTRRTTAAQIAACNYLTTSLSGFQRHVRSHGLDSELRLSLITMCG